MVIDPLGLIEKINSGDQNIKVEFGCGPNRYRADYITVDLLDNESVDIRADIYDFLDCLNKGTISAVYASHFVEHVADINQLMDKLAFVCKPGAIIEFIVPHFSNPFFYSDYTHRSFFGLYSFCYLANDRTGLRRGVPKYGLNPLFDLVAVDLKFRSYRPNYIRHALKRSLEKLVNFSNWTKEFYEEMMTWMAPCYEVNYRLKRVGNDID